MTDTTAVSMWEALSRAGVPREYRTLACTAFIEYMDAQTSAYAEALRVILHATEPIDLWPAS